MSLKQVTSEVLWTVLQKPQNAGPNKPRQTPYLQTISPKCPNCLEVWGKYLQIWLLSGIVGSSIPGFLQFLWIRP